MKCALIVGIDKYEMSGCDLRGCVNDANKMYNLCRVYGFNDIRVLTDKAATQQNIIIQLTQLINDTAAGDEVVYCHSGHGTQVLDMNGDEVDGLDECIVPYDHDWENPFTDDKLAKCLKHLHDEAYLSVVIDACHSGSATDAKVKNIEMPKKMRRLIKGKTLNTRLFGVKASGPKTQRHVLLAGCRDGEYSYEMKFRKLYGGVLTNMFYNAGMSRRFGNRRWNKIYKRVFRQVKRSTGNQQHPVLSGELSLIRRRVFGGK